MVEIRKDYFTEKLSVILPDRGLKPGQVRMIRAEEVTGTSFSTHMLPAPIVIDYIKQSCGCEALVLGIEPAQTDVMGPISKPISKAIDAVVSTICAAMGGKR